MSRELYLSLCVSNGALRGERSEGGAHAFEARKEGMDAQQASEVLAVASEIPSVLTVRPRVDLRFARVAAAGTVRARAGGYPTRRRLRTSALWTAGGSQRGLPARRSAS